jgi:hypothetical protein
MSALVGAALRRHSSADVRRIGLVALVPVALALLGVGIASADRPVGALRLTSADAARSGALIGLLPHAVGSSNLLEVEAPGAAALVAVSADGGQAALADQLGQASGTLTIAHGDGSQLRITLPGLVSAGFATDGLWLAVVDGRGALWRIDTATGDAVEIAAGPFLGSPVSAADGSLLLLSVSSVEAPYRSRVVRVSPSGAVAPLTNDELDYAAYPLADGALAVASHQDGRILVRRLSGGASLLLADLEPGAVNVAVASDGRRIAYELSGSGVELLDWPGASPRHLGSGSRPCFAADASSLLVRRGLGTAALALDGSVLTVTQRQAGLAGAVGCLP